MGCWDNYAASNFDMLVVRISDNERILSGKWASWQFQRILGYGYKIFYTTY